MRDEGCARLPAGVGASAAAAALPRAIARTISTSARPPPDPLFLISQAAETSASRQRRGYPE
jgi:hypothetical protein